MKKIITVLLILLPYLSNAEPIADSTIMNAQYSEQVFYSLDNGTVSSANNDNWHIALSTAGTGAAGSAILLNEASAILYACPFDTTAWTSFDTTGYKSWQRLLNSDTTWTNGAFNAYRGAAGTFDMGWGILNPANNFWTFGDSLYLIQFSGIYKKLWITSLKSGVWEFKYANIDGSDFHLVTFAKSTYPQRNFIYYSLSDHILIDREPANNSWDITFQKHTDYVNPPGTYVSVSSVFSNKKIWSAKSNAQDSASAMMSTQPQTTFTQNISNIGREWKKFSSATGWTVYDSIAYFVYNYDSTSLYRIVFTGFGGQNNGITYFYKEKIITNRIKQAQVEITSAIYPNPAHDDIHLFLDMPENTTATYYILDMSGNVVSEESLHLNLGIQQQNININKLSAGTYVLYINTKQGVIHHTFIKL
jgi:hypothetical protein